MTDHHVGMLAALSAALCWSVGSVVFESAGRRVGAFPLNLLRLTVGLGLIAVFHWALQGTLLVEGVAPWRLALLGLSGFIGLTIGDLCYFHSLLRLGPRVGVLLQGLAPPIATAAAWIWLDESLGWQTLAGIVLTLSGVSWVVAEPHGLVADSTRARNRGLGIALGAAAALCQSLGVVLARQAMNGPDGTKIVSPLSATLVRMTAATACAWLVILAGRHGTILASALRDRLGMRLVLIGAILGPFVGVWLSQVAVQNTPAGIASTLLATSPVMILPVLFVMRRERPTLRGVLGAVLAVLGVGLLS